MNHSRHTVNNYQGAIVLLLTICFSASINIAASSLDVQEIIYYRSEAATERGHQYQLELLELAMSKTRNDYGPYIIKPSSYEANQKRGLINLQLKNEINLLWSMTDIEREEKLLPIRIPLFKGLFGLRLCLVKKGQADRFKDIKTKQDWLDAGHSIGQGEAWPDTRILRANDLPIITSPHYSALFKMTARGRIDCFARSILEPPSELPRFEVGKIELESHLIFQYRAPIYFFVHKDDYLLAKRIETGLLRSIEDGSFDGVFYGLHENSFHGLNLENRQLIELDNPLLSRETPINDPKLWIDLNAVIELDK